tara:strand:- start:1095 stop:1196 length:102 start_codon:yes stop_codon:yes gene_type:complete
MNKIDKTPKALEDILDKRIKLTLDWIDETILMS